MNIVGKLSKQQRQAIQFFADNLFSKQMQRFVTLHFVFRKHMDCLGTTTINDYNEKYLPRDFIIEIDQKQTKDEVLVTIAHELVHVKQYLYKELNDDQSLWRGKKYEPDKLEYHEQPWEIEAESVAYTLFEGYKNGNV